MDFFGRALILVCVLITGATVIAQQPSLPAHELWPEIDTYFPITDRLRVLVTAREERAGEEGEGVKAYVGGQLDFFLTRNWLLRNGYEYGFRIGSGDRFKEHRFILEQTYSRDLPRKLAMHERNREELRVLNDDFSMRFRNRLRLEREFSLGKRSLIPYGSADIFYDTRYHVLNRNRLSAGLEFRFKKRTNALLNIREQKILDFYYLWQHDTRSSNPKVRAVGITFAIHF